MAAVPRAVVASVQMDGLDQPAINVSWIVETVVNPIQRPAHVPANPHTSHLSVRPAKILGVSMEAHGSQRSVSVTVWITWPGLDITVTRARILVV